jgi:hypothetical protein
VSEHDRLTAARDAIVLAVGVRDTATATDWLQQVTLGLIGPAAATPWNAPSAKPHEPDVRHRQSVRHRHGRQKGDRPRRGAVRQESRLPGLGPGDAPAVPDVRPVVRRATIPAPAWRSGVGATPWTGFVTGFSNGRASP